MTVGQHDTDDVVEAPLERLEIRQDQVDARLVLFRKEHSAVDDEDLAVVLEHGHVATDLAEPAEGRDAQRPLFECGGICDGDGHAVSSVGRSARPFVRQARSAPVMSQRVVPCTFGRAPPAAALRSGRKLEKSAPGTSFTRASSSSMSAASHSSGPTSGRRTRGLEMRPSPCRMYFAATVPGTCVMAARTKGSRRLCSAVAVA